MSDDSVAGLTTPEVSRLTGVPVSTLHDWVAKKLVRPSIRGPEGRRVACYWSIRDVVIVRTIRALREAGCPPAGVKRVKHREPAVKHRLRIAWAALRGRPVAYRLNVDFLERHLVVHGKTTVVECEFIGGGIVIRESLA